MLIESHLEAVLDRSSEQDVRFGDQLVKDALRLANWGFHKHEAGFLNPTERLDQGSGRVFKQGQIIWVKNENRMELISIFLHYFQHYDQTQTIKDRCPICFQKATKNCSDCD